MPAEPNQIVLVDQPGETSIRISAEVCSNGDLLLSGQDIGKAPEEIFGDSDYEYWLRVPAAARDRLLLALLEVLYQGDVSVVGKMKEMLGKKRIPCEFSSF
jgi:hypothetical protein